MIVAILAGGRARRMGGAKATAELAAAPLIARPLAAAREAGLEAVVVAKRATLLPALDAPVWIEPDMPFHPLCGLVAALERGPVIAVACDQPWVSGELLRALAAAGPAAGFVDGRYEPFPGHYVPSQLPVLRAALAEEASLRATLARLAPARFDLAAFGDPAQLVASVNTPEQLAAAARELGSVAAVSGAPDFAVIGGGIVGCSLAAFLAEAGASVVLYEREAIAAGASGRNSGVVQHPLDPALVALYEESLEHYATLGRGFTLPSEPVGLLLVSDCPDALPASPTEFQALNPTLLEGAELRAVEPALAGGLAAWRLETGRPVPPAAAAHAFALRAREAGAQLRVGEAATVALHDGRATGVSSGGDHHPAGAVAVAAGPWTSEAFGFTAFIAPLWGVVVELELADAPRHVLEEVGIEALVGSDEAPAALFSAVTARGISAVGSTFTAAKPDAEALAPGLLANATRFLPGLRGVKPRGLRACARPLSADGMPVLGAMPGIEGLAVASGHGAWGITLGPASARLVADQLLGRPAAIPPAFSPDRFQL